MSGSSWAPSSSSSSPSSPSACGGPGLSKVSSVRGLERKPGPPSPPRRPLPSSRPEVPHSTSRGSWSSRGPWRSHRVRDYPQPGHMPPRSCPWMRRECEEAEVGLPSVSPAQCSPSSILFYAKAASLTSFHICQLPLPLPAAICCLFSGSRATCAFPSPRLPPTNVFRMAPRGAACPPSCSFHSPAFPPHFCPILPTVSSQLGGVGVKDSKIGKNRSREEGSEGEHSPPLGVISPPASLDPVRSGEWDFFRLPEASLA